MKSLYLFIGAGVAALSALAVLARLWLKNYQAGVAAGAASEKAIAETNRADANAKAVTTIAAMEKAGAENRDTATDLDAGKF